MSDELAWFVQQLPGCLLLYDRIGRCLLANGALMHWLGRSEADILDRGLFELWPADVAAQEAADLDLVLAGQRLEQQENRLATPLGVLRRDHSGARLGAAPGGERAVRVVKFPWLSDGRVEGMVVWFDPVPPAGDTRPSGRPPETVGRLALGIVHDFNTSLALLRDQLGHLEELLGQRKAVDDVLGGLRKSVDGLCQLPRQLLDFVHNQPPARQRLDVNALLSSLEGVLRQSHPALELEYQLHPGGAWVEGDPLQLSRAFLNLAHHTLTADQKGSRLHLETRAVSLADAEGRRRGEIVRVTIYDSGPGPVTEPMPRVFEPLVGAPARVLPEQNSGRGRGTGLGLAIVNEVVHRHGGWVACQRNAGPGSRFVLHLPAAASPDAARVYPSRIGVLVVERDPDIRHLTALILEQGPFRASSAGSLEQAHQATLVSAEPIGLVVVAADLCIRRSHPYLVELLEQLPGAGLLVTTSGEPPVLPPSCRQALRGYLPKPYSADFLLRAAESAVGRNAALTRPRGSS